MLVRNGIAVSPGVVVGPALVLGSENFRIPRKYVGHDAVEAELARFHSAFTAWLAERGTSQPPAAERICKRLVELVNHGRDPGVFFYFEPKPLQVSQSNEPKPLATQPTSEGSRPDTSHKCHNSHYTARGRAHSSSEGRGVSRVSALARFQVHSTPAST